VIEMKTTFVVAGFGGQGIQFLTMLLAKTAIHKGLQVTLMKSYGPEARGGASAAYLTISDKYIINPVITKPDWLIAFNEFAYNTWKDKAKNHIFEDDLDNMTMLGKVIKKTEIVDLESVIETMKKEISVKYIDRLNKNIENLNKGYNSI